MYCWVLIFALSPFYISRDLSFEPDIYLSWSTSEIRVRLVRLSIWFFCWPFQGSTSFVDPFCYLCFMFIFCCLVCSQQPCDHVLWKGYPLASLVCCVFLCFCYFPIWCSGSSNVLNYFNSWPLPTSLLWLSELLCLRCMAPLNVCWHIYLMLSLSQSPAIACTITFHFSFHWISLCHFLIWCFGSGMVLDCIDSQSLPPSTLLWLSKLLRLCCVAPLKFWQHIHLMSLLFQSSSIACTIIFNLLFAVLCDIQGQLWCLILFNLDLWLLSSLIIIFKDILNTLIILLVVFLFSLLKSILWWQLYLYIGIFSGMSLNQNK